MANKNLKKTSLNICLMSDFFYPSFGGIETHIFCLAKGLMLLGHKVIVVTGNTTKNRQGVRYMANGLKAYYLPSQPLYSKSLVGTIMFVNTPFLRNIFIRESIDILHTHQHSSTLGQEAIIFANFFGIKTVYTCHSLYTNNNIGEINLNKLGSLAFNFLDHAIAVSNICKESVIVNLDFDPNRISVIPNGIESFRFKPKTLTDSGLIKRLKIIVLSRLVYRKGIEIIIKVIPIICNEFENVDFIIVGDGDKIDLVDEMVKDNKLENRIKISPSVPYNKVPEILVNAHIFLNGSLTESFCMAILEALSCGLSVVSTNVGAIPEVIPSELITLCEPKLDSMTSALRKAITNFHYNPIINHEKIKSMYSWVDTASSTLNVYKRVLKYKKKSIRSKMKSVNITNIFLKLYFFLIMIIWISWIKFLDFIYPENEIEKTIDTF